MPLSNFYVYAHTIASHDGPRPFGEIFYIGKGFGRRAKEKRNRSKHWDNIVKKYGYNVHYFESELTEEQAFAAEKRYIKAIGREDLGHGTLINLTDGGEGISGFIATEETKQKVSKSLIGNKRGQAHKGENSYMFGKTKSIYTKNKISDSTKGRINKTLMKKVIDSNGKIYSSIKEAAFNYGLKRTTLNNMLTGKNKNRTDLKYYN